MKRLFRDLDDLALEFGGYAEMTRGGHIRLVTSFGSVLCGSTPASCDIEIKRAKSRLKTLERMAKSVASPIETDKEKEL